MTNRRIVLAARPVGEPTPDNFRLETAELPPLGDGEVLLRATHLSLDPYMRGRMSDGPSYAAPVAIGQTMVAATVCEVVDSKAPSLQSGDQVAAYTGWQEYAVVPAKGLRKLDPADAPVSTSLGVLGMPGLTAWAGLLQIGQPKPGETVVVAAAAGAVGSAVGQIAKIHGCRVVGIAGGPEKCSHVVNDLGFDLCLDHRSPTLPQDLKQACPKGIDVYFENVGGKVFEAVLPRMNDFGRIPVCGLIAQYNATELPQGPDRTPLLMRTVLTKRLSLRGFIVTDFIALWPEFHAQMSAWVREGRIHYREQVVEGLDNAVEAFIGLLKGTNTGKMLIKL
jgi:NADPH-dependent curcumin reductase CurA